MNKDRKKILSISDLSVSFTVMSLTTGFPADKVVNQEELQKNTPIVTFRELINYDEL